MIKSLLIANRGEIACRIIRTARSLGIRTVAVYSDADAKALHVRQADEAVHIGPSPARESYLVGDKIIAAARATGAEAIHPGYGFLSENAGFAQAVIDAGLVWVGPRPASIEAMGLKDAAKQLMAAAGVPVTPGYMGANQDPGFLAGQAAEIGYPVLIKAVAGGGGKGMRLVESAADFADALVSCQREAAASFGNAHVLIEKYIQRPRHIEVQVFGDSHGNVVHLFERDCSLQRRHQKVIEEAPAPGMDEATRADLCAAAVRAAKAVDYEGAGTIEFIADASEGLRADRIWFMEMNTRLQVEHPVTEEITGVDLVEWQLRVASGEAIPLRQEELAINGHAIEARLYAEDPTKGFLPSTGRLEHFYLCDYGVTDRIETAVEEGDQVSPFYDPMVAKLITHASDRDEAIGNLLQVIGRSWTWPVISNAPFLFECLDSEVFRAADLSTGFIEQQGGKLAVLDRPSDNVVEDALSELVSNFGLDQHDGSYATVQTWPIGFRLNGQPRTHSSVQVAGETRDASFSRMWSNFPNGTGEPRSTSVVCPLFPDKAIIVERGRTFMVSMRNDGTGHHSAHDGDILSPMPGKVIAVEVSQGQAVTKGQKLLTLEAMKMEHTLTAPFDGVVAELNATPGAQVQVEALLARIEAASE
jgi:3-methylcrotonyl-CoA carboxylase alpha subunit